MKQEAPVQQNGPMSTHASDVVATVTSSDFNRLLSETKKTLVVRFGAKRAGPSRMLDPMLDEFAREQKESVRVVNVDVDQDPELSNRFHIRNIPTLLLFLSGALKDTIVGLTTKADLTANLNALGAATNRPLESTTHQ